MKTENAAICAQYLLNEKYSPIKGEISGNRNDCIIFSYGYSDIKPTSIQSYNDFGDSWKSGYSKGR